MNEQIRFDKIFYPSDFSPESEVAFHHALKIALKSKAFLQMMHIDTSNQADWEDFPGVRETLERWQMLPSGSPKGAVREHGLEVCKVIASSKDPVQACLDYFKIHIRIMSMTKQLRFEFVVIGGGPAGISGAMAAGILGKSVALIEKEVVVGGAGINTGTIPSKTLRETALVLSGGRSRQLFGVDLSLRREATIADFMCHEKQVKSLVRKRSEI